mmetsp:Transcript_6628/g.27826  ORF Transcript_6628/g.27826 Transcript_6628/m.27826 type:complete len:222 (-) Transcript_6628:470-1135(-)
MSKSSKRDAEYGAHVVGVAQRRRVRRVGERDAQRPRRGIPRHRRDGRRDERPARIVVEPVFHHFWSSGRRLLRRHVADGRDDERLVGGVDERDPSIRPRHERAELDSEVVVAPNAARVERGGEGVVVGDGALPARGQRFEELGTDAVHGDARGGREERVAGWREPQLGAAPVEPSAARGARIGGIVERGVVDRGCGQAPHLVEVPIGGRGGARAEPQSFGR